jgi:prephenate dehydrogenase
VKSIAGTTAGIAGLGLMGGSFARALGRLRASGAPFPKLIYACDRDPRPLEAARAQGIIDGSFPPEHMLPRCDLVFLCLNPSTLITFTERYMDFFKSGALLTDTAGVKRGAAGLAVRIRDDLDFIPGHPMTGVEGEGFAASENVVFAGKNYILTPVARNRPENLAALRELLRTLGFGRITETTPEDHDDKIAFTSQLCHVIAAALVDCEDDLSITRYGGGSFEDLTRIALLNSPMWTELFLENREKLLERIEGFEQSLDEIKTLISGSRAEELEARLAAVRKRRSGMLQTETRTAITGNGDNAFPS